MADKRAANKPPKGMMLRHSINGAHAGCIHWLSWSPQGDMLATASEDGSIGLWDAYTGELCARFRRHADQVRCVDWSPDGCVIASGSDDESILVWDLETQLLYRQLWEHFSSILSLAWSPQGHTFASGHADGSVMLWNAGRWKPYRHIFAHEGGVTRLSWSPDGTYLASGSSADARICLWGMERETKRLKPVEDTKFISSLAWSPDGEMLASGVGDNTIRLWDARRKRQLHELTGHKRPVIGVSFSADGNLLVSKSQDNTIRIWRTDNWQSIVAYKESSYRCPGVAFHPKEPVLASIDDDRSRLNIWDLELSQLGLVLPSSADPVRRLDRDDSASFKKWVGASQATLALLFTDIVDGTDLTTKVGNHRMKEIQDAHFERARRLLSHYNGYLVKIIGDELMIAFRTAIEAFYFALTLYGETGDPRIHIRAGLHVGVVKVEEKDAFGAMINFTKRIESQAKGAEIWLSERAKEDIEEEGSLAPTGLSWIEHNNCELKGFPGKYRLWSVAQTG